MKRLGIFVLVAALVGCHSPESGIAPEPSAIVVTDSLGRTVTLPRAARRIVSLAPAATETLFAIGAGSHVVAVTSVDTYPTEVKELPKVGGFAPKTLNLEAILALRPDLVICTGGVQESLVGSLEQLGLTVLVQDAHTIEQVTECIRTSGRVTGCEGRAEEIAQDIARRAEAVRRRAREIPEERRPRTVYFLWDSPLMAGGPGTLIGQMISDAGGVNLFADAAQVYPQVSDEAVLQRDPQLVLTADHGNVGLPARLTKRPGWNMLSAVKSGRVVALDEDQVTRPGPRIIAGFEAVAAAIRRVSE